MQQIILTARDVAQALNVSQRTVARMVLRGDLAAQRVPGYKGPLLFDPADVDALKAKRDDK